MAQESARVTCCWCKSPLSRSAALLTAAISDRASPRRMCLKCAVWSLTGYAPPYVSRQRSGGERIFLRQRAFSRVTERGQAPFERARRTRFDTRLH